MGSLYIEHSAKPDYLRQPMHRHRSAGGHRTGDGKGVRRGTGAVVLASFKEDAVKAEAQKLAAAGHKAIAVGCELGCAGGAVLQTFARERR